jgi:predicted acyltransferase (DUF342 family)
MPRRPLALALALAIAALAVPAFAHDPEVEAEHPEQHKDGRHDNEQHDERHQGGSRSRVMGGLHAGTGEVVGDFETVNGGISIDDRARAGHLSTVNGGIDIEDDAQAASATTVNGGIEVGERARITGDLTTVNGGIRVDFLTKIGGNVETVNGAITIRQSDVAGNVELVNGDVMIGAKSHVHGSVIVRRNKGVSVGWGRKPKVPRIIIGPGAMVDGDLRFEREVELYVHTTARIGNVIGAKAISYTDTIPARE